MIHVTKNAKEATIRFMIHVTKNATESVYYEQL